MMTVKSFRSDIGRVRGSGSGRSGTEESFGMQLTFLAFIPLALYFVGSFLFLVAFKGGDYEYAVAWLRFPPTGIVGMLTLALIFRRSAGELKEFIDDYLHGGWHIFALLFVKTGAILLTLAGSVAILKIMLGA